MRVLRCQGDERGSLRHAGRNYQDAWAFEFSAGTDYRVFHGSVAEASSFELEAGWDEEEPHSVMLKNIPAELCEDGGGEEWQQLDLLAYRVTSVVLIDPAEGGSIEMVWPRGVGTSGWRLLDQTLDGHPDPEVPPYYDCNYYENWARLEDVVDNQYTFVSYTYRIVREGEDCWVPFDPNTQAYHLNYSYVAYDPNMPSGIENPPESRTLGLTVSSTVVHLDGSVRLTMALPERAQVWLGVYGVDGRLVHMFENGAQRDAGITGVTWDLMNQTNGRVTAGVYFVRARARLAGTGQSVTRARVVVVK